MFIQIQFLSINVQDRIIEDPLTLPYFKGGNFSSND